MVQYRASRAVGLVGRALRRIAFRQPLNLPAIPPVTFPVASPDGDVAGPVRAVIIDERAPRPDIDSGSVRTTALIRILTGFGLSPAFIANDFATAAVPAGVNAPKLSGIRDAVRWLTENRADLRVVVVSRHSVAACWRPVLRAVAPEVPVVFDTVDLHFLREARAARKERSAMAAMLAARTRMTELDLIRNAAATWVVSDEELKLLARLLPDARVTVVSNIVDREPIIAPYERRDGFVFVGNFRHAPNLDAVEWLAGGLWPAILARRPQSRLLVIGPSLPASNAARLSTVPGITIAGHVPDLSPFLQSARVMLAPLRYGAGVKGKINSAFACGLPVVATSCAIEGMNWIHAPALRADDTDAFAEAAARLHDTPEEWHELQHAAFACLDARFSTTAARKAVAASLGALGVALDIP